ncbi:response regulator [Flammeovirga sp. EKP202]|uniref:response regulator n=1 Tax=Flammeovirga sp. EKP202 TaxID=2770592 RepID=UPI00165FB1A1|nr:response regulator [Flammeovirga sp. EKP202]MBD0401423.1 response regulator transcription factor [Flammeovirga sp. EKP202]
MRKSILVVDDDLFIRDITSHVLGVNNDILLAHDVLNARKILQNNHVDLVLLDIELEKETSECLFDDLQQTNEIPVMIFSSNKDPMIRDNFIDLGIVDYVQKPFNMNELEVKIQDLLLQSNPRKMQKKRREFHFKNWFLNLMKFRKSA